MSKDEDDLNLFRDLFREEEPKPSPASWNAMDEGTPGSSKETQAPGLPKVTGFVLLQLLGRGGMGAVYRARQESLDRIVALKLMKGDLSEERSFVQRFLMEARNAGRLRHENLVSALDCGEVDGHYFIVMEYIEGKAISSILKDRKRLPEHEALGMVRQVARGLDYATGHRIIHRDIKPENLLLTGGGVVKICDLGLSRRLDDSPHLTMTGTVHCTAAYASPEQARGEKDLDARCDIYSLGVTLYQLVTGEVPFKGSSSAVVLTKHLTEAPKPPSAVEPSVSEPVSRLILKMMAKKREDRFASHGDVVRAIDNIRALSKADPTPARKETPTPAVGTPRTRRFRPTSKSNTPLLVGGIAAAALLVVVLAVSSMNSGSTDVPSSRQRSTPAPLFDRSSHPDLTSPSPPAVVENAPDSGRTQRDPLPVAPDFDRALEEIRDIIRQDPGFRRSVEVRSLIAISAEKAGTRKPEFDRVLADYERDLLKSLAPAPSGPALTVELAELDAQVGAHLKQEEFIKATLTLQAARSRHPQTDWGQAVDARSQQVADTKRARFISLRDQALTELRRNPGAADAIVARIRGWGDAGLDAELSVALRAAVALPFPPPARRPGAIDLLSRISLPGDIQEGAWTKDAKGLTCTFKPWSRVMIPYVPPAEYDLLAVVERLEGSNCFDLGLVMGKSQFVLEFDGRITHDMAGLANIDGKYTLDNSTARRGTVLFAGRPTVIEVAVRTTSVTVRVDGGTFLKWEGSPNQLSLLPQWAVRRTDALFLGAFASFLVRRLEILPIGSSGAVDTPAPPVPAKEKPVAADPPLAPGKPAPPPDRDRRTAEDELHKVYKARLASGDRASKRTVAQELLKLGEDLKSEATMRFACLSKAREHAVAGMDLETALSAAIQLHEQFSVKLPSNDWINPHSAHKADVLGDARRKIAGPTVEQDEAALRDIAPKLIRPPI